MNNIAAIAKTWNKEEIESLLEAKDEAILRAVVAIYKKQTDDEKDRKHTIDKNGIGFTGCDGRTGTFHGEYLTKWEWNRPYVQTKILPYWKRFNKKGKMKICKYATQLTKIANREI